MAQRSELGMLENLVVNIRSAGTATKDAGDALDSFLNWFQKHYDPIRQLPSDVRGSLNSLEKALKSMRSSTSSAISDIDETLYAGLSGRKASREQFHLLTALGGLNYTNKSVGLGEFDDYEIYCFFCYEDETRCVVIDPQMRPDQPEEIVADNYGDEAISGRVGLGAFYAPENLSWDKLSTAQRSFFEKHLPDVACRFARQQLE